MEGLEIDRRFWAGRRVFVTGHTGFKGSWLCLWLASLGARIAGYALAPATRSLYDQTDCASAVADSTFADIRQTDRLRESLTRFMPEVVFHLAAQPLVRRSYAEPVETISVNVLGTAILLDEVRNLPGMRAVVAVTSDKCYEDNSDGAAHRETDRLGGASPYACSKACAELVISAFRVSYFGEDSSARIASARAGNVIGGGDWAEDRLVPDIARAAASGLPAVLRYPAAVRPWQHVLDPLAGYLLLAQALWRDPGYCDAWNFGPDARDSRSVQWLAERIAGSLGAAITHRSPARGLNETAELRIDASRARAKLGWTPRLGIEKGADWTAAWYSRHARGEAARDLVYSQIAEYERK